MWASLNTQEEPQRWVSPYGIERSCDQSGMRGLSTSSSTAKKTIRKMYLVFMTINDNLDSGWCPLPHVHPCQECVKRRLGSSWIWSKEMYTSSSPDLNPLVYSIRAHVANMACTYYRGNDRGLALKTSIEKMWWATTSEGYIKKCCVTFRSRVGAAMKAEGVFKN